MEWQSWKELSRQFGLTSDYNQGNFETEVMPLDQGHTADHMYYHNESPS